MRISTAGIHHAALNALLGQQSVLSRTQQQIASGKRVQTPADDPVAAVHIMELQRALAESDQFDAQRRHGEESPDPGRAGTCRREHADHARARAHRPGQQRLRRSGEPPHARHRSAQPAERAGGHRQPARRQRRIPVFGLRLADAAVRADRRRRSATSATRATARCRSAPTSASSTATRAPTCSWR